MLPYVAEEVKEDICRIIARLDRRLNDVDVQKIIDNVWSLHAMGLANVGTGFLISNGYVITAYHVVKNAGRIDCQIPSGNEIHLDLFRYSEPYDIALLKPEITWSRGVNISRRVPTPTKGELVFTYGYPLGYRGPEPILSVGFLSGVCEEGSVKKLVANIAFNVGNSGGPLFNLRGQLLGIVRAKYYVALDPMLRNILREGLSRIVFRVQYTERVQYPVTLGDVIERLIKWVADNVQVNIGEAVSVKHLIELLSE